MASFTFSIEPIPPFRLDLTAWALRRRPENMIDHWDGAVYSRVLLQDDTPLTVHVSQEGKPEAPRLAVVVQGARDSPRTRAGMRKILEKTLGTRLDLSGFYRMAEQDTRLKALAGRFRGLKPPRFPAVFEALVNAIACQQLSLTVGILILSRLAAACGKAAAEGGHAFPRPVDLLSMGLEGLRRLGFSYAKARAALDLARAAQAGEIDLELLSDLDDDRVRKSLSGLKGIGRWSIEYTLLRGLGRLAVFPGDDVGASKRLRQLFGLSQAPGYEEIDRLLSRWKPYGGLVYLHLLLSGLAEKGLV